jgi:hypothetical protein
VFGDLPVIGARGPAASALEALNLCPHRMTLLGPLILIAAPGQDSAYDTAEWTLETDGEGRILVTSGPARAARYERLDTGLRGRVVGGRVSLEDGE